MFQNVLDKPSFYAHIFTGIAILTVLLLLYFYYKRINFSFYQKLILILMISILVGIHGLSHHLLEIYYGFNPIHSLMNQYQ